jgi:LacI family transcriptional regulator
VIVPGLSNYFYHSFISSIEEDARIYGYSVIIYRLSNDPAIELEILNSCQHERVSGYSLPLLLKRKIWSAFLSSIYRGFGWCSLVKSSYESCNKICVGDAHAGELAAGEILKKGKKNILAIFGDPNMSITSARLERFASCLYEGSPHIFLEVIYASSSEENRKK